ncbi:MAG: hypothetical protein K2Q20_12060, partial [Phycisphaerales bacterium]|nr:hypothetical protein [Phycisphaerales bacterium]
SFEVWAWMGSIVGGTRYVYPSGWYDRSWGATSHYQQRNLKPGDPAWQIEGNTLDPNAEERPEPAIGQRSIIKTINNVPLPSSMLLTRDQDDPPGGTNEAKGWYQNWPDELDNHGKDGVQMSFLDGSVRWIKTGPLLMETYLLSNTVPSLWVRQNWQRLHSGVAQRTIRIDRNNAVEWVIERGAPR